MKRALIDFINQLTTGGCLMVVIVFTICFCMVIDSIAKVLR